MKAAEINDACEKKLLRITEKMPEAIGHLPVQSW